MKFIKNYWRRIKLFQIKTVIHLVLVLSFINLDKNTSFFISDIIIYF